jgi:hypothetical protein
MGFIAKSEPPVTIAGIRVLVARCLNPASADLHLSPADEASILKVATEIAEALGLEPAKSGMVIE